MQGVGEGGSGTHCSSDVTASVRSSSSRAGAPAENWRAGAGKAAASGAKRAADRAAGTFASAKRFCAAETGGRIRLTSRQGCATGERQS